jgi:hypothetical protein
MRINISVFDNGAFFCCHLSFSLNVAFMMLEINYLVVFLVIKEQGNDGRARMVSGRSNLL